MKGDQFSFTLHVKGKLKFPKRHEVTNTTRITFTGLGCSEFFSDLAEEGIKFRILISQTPIDREYLDLRLATSVKTDSLGHLHPLLKIIPHKWSIEWLLNTVSKQVVRVFKQDIGIWNHKKYLPQPHLAEGDGPIMLYRKWARQFYLEDFHQSTNKKYYK